MKKIFVDVYLAYNLGDDLFVDILSKRYPNAEFTLNYVGNGYDSFIKKYNNIKRRKYNVFNKITQKLKIKDTLTNYKLIAEEHDALVFVGGSIFRDESYHESLYEDRNRLVNEFKVLDKPVFILGSNFGPYKRNEFIDDYTKFFKSCNDVCFRESYSYNLFKDISQVRYEPDIVFQLNLDKYKKTNKSKIAGFSIIDVNHKDGLSKYYEEYKESTVKSIELLVSKGYRCSLMSFCEKEGDLKVINNIISNLDDRTRSYVSIYEYKGDLEESFNIISEFKLLIGARFHANIIAQLLDIPILPIIYSDKTSNMLKDINLDKLMITMDNIHMQFDEDVINKAFNNKVNLKDVSKKSENQFEILTNFIEK
ncbi:MAG: polysaccharide pyruvyl transferase family protein [Clostridium sp.]